MAASNKLVILESPTKASTVQGYLGSGYKVVASKGHVRDLPKSTLGVDIEHDFEPKYINIRGKGDLIKELKRAAKSAKNVYIATDPDREGEAIAWHLSVTLGIPLDEDHRVTFNEITKGVVKEAIKHPRKIDMGLVGAQQARRILDRIVGYKLSPYLWSTVKSGLSAGRVQSVATKIIVDREEEIRAFVPVEYWTEEATLETPRGDKFKAHYYGGAEGKKSLPDKSSADRVKEIAERAMWRVESVKFASKMRQPAPPFTTSTLQQEASRKLNFTSVRTMRAAQELYEGVNLGTEYGGVQGLITYMRTDSVRISVEAQSAARDYIASKFGEKYVPEKPRVFKMKKENVQDAHEAVRPASPALEPSKIKRMLTSDQYKLYNLIWNRFIASQMQSAEIGTVTAVINADGEIFHATGSTVKFPGFLALYEETDDRGAKESDSASGLLPEINEGEIMNCLGVAASQHYTEPPMRYTEASLIKFLEELGIGRPSTYLLIVPTITQRGYVAHEGKSLLPTELGEATTRLMKQSFPDIVDYGFTAELESKLDMIEEGKTDVKTVLSEFYDGFSKELETATENAEKLELPVEETDIICDKCGARMIVKTGRYGKFAACPNYPECKNTKSLEEPKTKAAVSEEDLKRAAEMKCEKCGGVMTVKQGPYGAFFACANYPKCKFSRPITHPTGVKCPKCGGDIIPKWGRKKTMFYSCSNYPTCDFSSWDEPLSEKCPTCGGMLYRKKGKDYIICKTEGCGYKRAEKHEDSSDVK
ncbi:MAG: type I DNA topoisomerase [Firmicutes bacterium]|nr:type I DNA topoisomerase [Bacillota bacterium]